MIRAIIHFLAIGAVILVVERSFTPTPETRDAIVIGAREAQRLEREWAAETGHGPSAAERGALLASAIDEEVLVRTALRLKLHETDSVTRRRLVQDLRFVSSEPMDEAEAFRRAVALGMEKRELVVRRRLAERVADLLRDTAKIEEPTDEEFRSWIESHPERFPPDRRVSFRQRFLAADPFPLGGRFDALSPRDVTRLFGDEFTAALWRAPVGRWAGPIRSAHGEHLVFVEGVEERPTSLESVRQRARGEIVAARREEALRERLGTLRSAYRVTVAGSEG